MKLIWAGRQAQFLKIRIYGNLWIPGSRCRAPRNDDYEAGWNESVRAMAQASR